MASDIGRFLGMEAGVARAAAKAAGFRMVSERTTSPPAWQPHHPWAGDLEAGDFQARVLRARIAGPGAIEFVIAREQRTLDESKEPPR